MKRIIVLLLALLSFTSVSLAEPWRVFDNARVFSEGEIAAIEQKISDFQRETGMDFAVLTTDDYLGKTTQKNVSDMFFISENIGFGRETNGMLYYIDMNQFMHCASTGGELITIFDDSEMANALDSCAAFLADNNYQGAVFHMINIAKAQIKEAQ